MSWLLKPGSGLTDETMIHWDAIVIGGGCNGLAAAALLAKHGQRILLIEQRPVVGGLSGTCEYRPGHWIQGLRPYIGGYNLDLLKPLNLVDHGLTLHDVPSPATVRDIDGKTVDVQSEGGYQNFKAFCLRVAPLLRAIFATPLRPFSLTHAARLVRALPRCGIRHTQTLARVVPLSAQDFLDEFFTCDIVKGALAAPMLLRTFGGPWTPFGALQLMLHEAMRGRYLPHDANLLHALHASAMAHGVTIQTGRRAVRITPKTDDRVVVLTDHSELNAKSVIATCSLKLLMDSLLDPVQTASHHPLRARGTCAILALEMHQDPQLNITGRIRCALDITEIERAFDCVKHDRIPDQQVLDVSVSASSQSAITVRVHALQTPYTPSGGWTPDTRHCLQQRILKQLYTQIPELADRILDVHLWTPTDLDHEYALPGGHLWHFERDIDQLMCPVPTTLPSGVYWGKTHMESGFVCASGIKAARQALSRRNRI